MMPNPLILGGTTQATALALHMADAGLTGTLSLAGRVARPKRQPLPLRVGGFGGIAGLAEYIEESGITHVIDATHPFAEQMSRHAVAACELTNVPLIAFSRPPWTAQTGDNWQRVPDIAGAVAALDCPARRVMLAVGRMHLADFAPNPQHHYLLRLVDPPQISLPLPKTVVLVDRGPFTVANDAALMKEHAIDLVVSKNSGGTGAIAKVTAARQLGLPMIMIDRPALPDRQEVFDVADVMSWLSNHGVERGV
jgi:precorrin-6A/cobalt-precorrin-6A reductase